MSRIDTALFLIQEYEVRYESEEYGLQSCRGDDSGQREVEMDCTTSSASVSVCLSVTSRCSIEIAERIELLFGTRASFHPSYTVLRGIRVSSKVRILPANLTDEKEDEVLGPSFISHSAVPAMGPLLGHTAKGRILSPGALQM